MIIGALVHYVARGSADGKYPPVCRAALVTGWESGPILDLFVITSNGSFHDHDIPHAPEGDPGTWHELEECDDHE